MLKSEQGFVVDTMTCRPTFSFRTELSQLAHKYSSLEGTVSTVQMAFVNSQCEFLILWDGKSIKPTLFLMSLIFIT